MDRLLASCGPRVYVACNWPWPVKKPWQRAQMDVHSVGGGIGDELMCASVFKEVKRRNPICKITFRSRYPELFDGRDDIDTLAPYVPDDLNGSRGLTYAHSIPPIRPIIQLLAEGLGIIGAKVKCTPPKLDPDTLTPFSELRSDKPLVVIQPETSSEWTSLKRWQSHKWNGLLSQLVEIANVVEVGKNPFMDAELGDSKGKNFHSLAGMTSLTELAQVISQATVFVGLPSVGLHLANAYDVPAVIIFGGYEHPDGLGYSNVSACYSDLSCAPCWIRGNACPYNLRCMHEISEERVFNMIAKALRLRA